MMLLALLVVLTTGAQAKDKASEKEQKTTTGQVAAGEKSGKTKKSKKGEAAQQSAQVVIPAEQADTAFTVQAVAEPEPAPEPDEEFDPSVGMADYNAPKPYILKDIKVNGIKYFDPNILAASTGLVRGDTIYLPSNYLSQALTHLWNQRYFSDVKIVAEPQQGDSVNLLIFLTERPRIYSWKFNGARKGETTDLVEQTKLRRGDELSDYILNKDINLIKKFYIDKGFRNVEVDVAINNDSVIKNGVNLVFDIQKHSKVKIGKINFEGNEVFKDSRLRASLKKIHQKGWKFWQGAKFKQKEYDEAKENVIDFYNSKGYRNAVIAKDSIYDINSKRMGIDFQIEEGNKYYFRNVTWVGNSVYPTEQLQAMLGIKSGDTYDKKTLGKRLGTGKDSTPDDMSVVSLYQNEGYLFFQVDPAETIIGADSIDLELKIFEGKQATVNNVNISGNLRINDDVIRRELYVRPGELYNRAMLMNTIRLLSQMRHFNPESMNPGINPISAELVDISFPLEEVQSDQLEASGGWGAGMFVGTVGITINNLSLRNMFSGKKGQWRPYPHGQGQTLQLRAQSNGSYYKSFMASFTEPWFGGRKPNSFTVSAYYSDETNAYYMWQQGTKHFRTLGMSVGIGQRLSWPDPYFTLYNEVAFQSYNLKDWDYFIVKNGTSNIVSFKTVFGRSSVDQPIYPRRGSDFSISLALTPPYSLFDGKDYSDPTLSDNERYHWIEYHKWGFKGTWYHPLSRNNNLVVMAKMEMGFLGAYNKDKQSPFEGYDVGGDGMVSYNVYGVDIIGLRGYENGAITPTSGYARAYNKYTVEMRYPFILKPQSQIYGLVFAEAGNAFPTWKDFNPFQVKRAIGAGVRLFLPMVGMIGVDFGYGFDCPAGSTTKSRWQPHFMIGQQF